MAVTPNAVSITFDEAIAGCVAAYFKAITNPANPQQGPGAGQINLLFQQDPFIGAIRQPVPVTPEQTLERCLAQILQQCYVAAVGTVIFGQGEKVVDSVFIEIQAVDCTCRSVTISRQYLLQDVTIVQVLDAQRPIDGARVLAFAVTQGCGGDACPQQCVATIKCCPKPVGGCPEQLCQFVCRKLTKKEKKLIAEGVDICDSPTVKNYHGRSKSSCSSSSSFDFDCNKKCKSSSSSSSASFKCPKQKKKSNKKCKSSSSSSSASFECPKQKKKSNKKCKSSSSSSSASFECPKQKKKSNKKCKSSSSSSSVSFECPKQKKKPNKKCKSSSSSTSISFECPKKKCKKKRYTTSSSSSSDEDSKWNKKNGDKINVVIENENEINIGNKNCGCAGKKKVEYESVDLKINGAYPSKYLPPQKECSSGSCDPCCDFFDRLYSLLGQMGSLDNNCPKIFTNQCADACGPRSQILVEVTIGSKLYDKVIYSAGQTYSLDNCDNKIVFLFEDVAEVLGLCTDNYFNEQLRLWVWRDKNGSSSYFVAGKCYGDSKHWIKIKCDKIDDCYRQLLCKMQKSEKCPSYLYSLYYAKVKDYLCKYTTRLY